LKIVWIFRIESFGKKSILGCVNVQKLTMKRRFKMNTKKYFLAFLLVGVLLAVQAWPASARMPAQTISGDLNQIVTDLSLLEPYIHYVEVGGVQTQVLDADAALAAGFSNEVILLAQEMVAFQNDLVVADVAESTNSRSPKVDEYPGVKQFFDLATANLTIRDGDPSSLIVPNAAASIPPCGNWSYPVPNFTPGRYNFSASNPTNKLISWGFHHTARYACRGNGCSAIDFTRGRSYTGPYGTCSSPRFRDEGVISGPTAFYIQYGEPNPEIHGYIWPYWNWGSYVLWWHNTY